MEGIGSAAETRDQFMQLLVTQLRHQDPLEPTKQEDFLAQLAQFSTLEGIEKLNDNLEGFLSSQADSQTSQNSFFAEVQRFNNISAATSLVGKTVDFTLEGGGASSGRVEAVLMEEDKISLRVGEQLVPINDIHEVRTAAPTAIAEDAITEDAAT